MTTAVNLTLRQAVGGDGANDIRLRPAPAAVRLSQQYLEILNSDAANTVRLSQQYIEILNAGSDNRVRLSQQYLEILHAFGTPPPGKSHDAPGRNKPPPSIVKWLAFIERERRHRNRHTGRFSNPPAIIYADQYLPPNPIPIRQIDVVKTVRID